MSSFVHGVGLFTRFKLVGGRGRLTAVSFRLGSSRVHGLKTHSGTIGKQRILIATINVRKQINGERKNDIIETVEEGQGHKGLPF